MDIVTYTGSISKKELIQSLEGALSRHPHCDIIAKVIVENLAKSQVGIDQLIKSFLGIEPKTLFNVGDKVWVNVKHLPQWRMNLGAMREKGMIFQDCLECTILEIDLYTYSSLSIEYTMIESDGTETTSTYTITQEQANASDSGVIDF